MDTLKNLNPTETKHKHVWYEKENYIMCDCGKRKLKLTKPEGSDVLTGTKSDGSTYKVRSNRDRIFNPEEWHAFYSNLKLNQQFTFKFLLLTGARIMEAQGVKVEDIDFGNQRIILKRTKQRHGENIINKSKTRTLRISKDLTKEISRRILQNKLQPEDYLGILSQPAAHIALKRACKLAKIKDYEMLSVHSVRKTSENWALSIGVDSMKLSTRFGHNLMTQYEHYSQSDSFTPREKQMIRDYYGDTFI